MLESRASRIATILLTALLSNRMLVEHQWEIVLQYLFVLDPTTIRGRKDIVVDELRALVNM